jgi:hypothetical protein
MPLTVLDNTGASGDQKACPHKEGCELFPYLNLQPLLKLWQLNYCDADFTKCARYKLSLAGQPVPLMLLPSGKHLEVPLPALPKTAG